jgi:hypothetical protein
LNASKNVYNEKVGNHLKKFFYLACLAGIGLFFTACMVGYVGTEPAYVAYSRPPSQSNHSIWIDGNWYWNNSSNIYVQKSGYWENQRPGHTYVAGYWQSSLKGKSWAPGHWQKEKNTRKNNK